MLLKEELMQFLNMACCSSYFFEDECEPKTRPPDLESISVPRSFFFVNIHIASRASQPSHSRPPRFHLFPIINYALRNMKAWIQRLSKNQLMAELADLNLPTDGNMEELRQRMRA